MYYVHMYVNNYKILCTYVCTYNYNYVTYVVQMYVAIYFINDNILSQVHVHWSFTRKECVFVCVTAKVAMYLST